MSRGRTLFLGEPGCEDGAPINIKKLHCIFRMLNYCVIATLIPMLITCELRSAHNMADNADFGHENCTNDDD
eukprot:scaffold43277_cov66-Attheya_sp.AAC.2